MERIQQEPQVIYICLWSTHCKLSLHEIHLAMGHSVHSGLQSIVQFSDEHIFWLGHKLNILCRIWLLTGWNLLILLTSWLFTQHFMQLSSIWYSLAIKAPVTEIIRLWWRFLSSSTEQFFSSDSFNFSDLFLSWISWTHWIFRRTLTWLFWLLHIYCYSVTRTICMSRYIVKALLKCSVKHNKS